MSPDEEGRIIMAVTKRDLVTWAETLQLLAQLVLVAVEALADDQPVDFEAVKIRTTPADALRRARQQQDPNRG